MRRSTLMLTAALAALPWGQALSARELPAKPTPTARMGTMTADEATAMARDVSVAVERLRGLKFKRPVPVKVVDDAAARKHFIARAQRFWPEETSRIEQRAYTQLGLLPAGFDLVKGLFDMLEEQVGGYYDPEAGTFFVLDDMPRAYAALLMAHELTHALDDQYHGIDALLQSARDEDDRGAAIASVVEGSGTIVMSVFLIQELRDGRMTPAALLELQQSESGRALRLRAAPPYLQRSLLSSYLLGQSFLLRGNLMALVSGVPSADLDRAFRDPPTSTEQVLHPEKYWDAAKRDLPRRITLGDLAPRLGSGWRKAGDGTLGELGLAVLTGLPGLDPTDPGSAAASGWTNAAATGWGGDVYEHYTDGSRGVTLLATQWDTAADAAEFERALPSVTGRQVWREGDAVVIVAGDAPERHGDLARGALSALAGKEGK